MLLRKRKGSAVLIMAILAAVLSGLIGLSTAKVQGLAFNALNASKIEMQAQQHAAAKMSLLQTSGYGALAAQAKKAIGGTSYFDEVTLGKETAYKDGITQRPVSVKVYYDKNRAASATLDSIMYSNEGGSVTPSVACLTIPPNGTQQVTVPADANGVAVFCSSNWADTHPGKNGTSTNKVTLDGIGSLTMSYHAVRESRGYVLTPSRCATNYFKKPLKKNDVITIKTSWNRFAGGSWYTCNYLNTSVFLIFG